MSRLDDAVQKAVTRLSDGLDASDVPLLFRDGVEIAEAYGDLSGPEKREFCLAYITEVIERAHDVPGPDWITKPVFKWFVQNCGPGIVDLVIEATQHRLIVNR